MKRAEVRRDGVVLSCLDGGSGDDVIVLLHGLAGSGQEMVPTAEALLPDHHVIAVDQRGHGHSTRRPQDLSRRAYVEDVVAVVEELAGGGPVTVVGQSMGGHTAMLLAAGHPDLVDRLVMLEAGVGGSDPEDNYPARLGDWFASWPVPFADLRGAAEFLGTTPIARSWLRDLDRRADGLWPRFEPDVMRAAIAAVAESARWDEWQQVKAPTLLVQGQHGTIAAAEVRRMLSLRPDVAHVVIPDAGHDVHLEQRVAFVRALRMFLGR
ncbi:MULTISPECIES: alpha/beta fold hydrolase [Micromonospora]|uniref:Alpha/beta hydrolase n=1 Tax=Micromonospora solifontis TaxID=2487138 RepID=A0ABX9WL24_9ACTN|nr:MULTISPECIES: alpha/beta hydrolase [Micromonospora]NES14901.1 alpha/beta hydrolase [Micromonospora sp. PPF5-17B]NES35176.1 alpha/beta hydrolase [Micromonospora solifontis]NES55171.1 alpha/beta hydrolase [Micromonospora sp. PPF5-6]RNM01157.1 alpha/beta hydrolase [Micromonospora solifontis]